MEGIIGIIQIIAGAIGGNATGAAAKNYSLGTAGNSIGGAVGGLIAGQVLTALGIGEPRRLVGPAISGCVHLSHPNLELHNLSHVVQASGILGRCTNVLGGEGACDAQAGRSQHCRQRRADAASQHQRGLSPRNRRVSRTWRSVRMRRGSCRGCGAEGHDDPAGTRSCEGRPRERGELASPLVEPVFGLRPSYARCREHARRIHLWLPTRASCHLHQCEPAHH
jgi:hypothetical protein